MTCPWTYRGSLLRPRRNLSQFYLLAHQIAERPPRIHRLGPIVEKLETYEIKFADLARRISVRSVPVSTSSTLLHVGLICYIEQLSHERLRALDLRAAHRAESIRREEGRARRMTIREELRRVRGTIRAMRQRLNTKDGEGLDAGNEGVARAGRGRDRHKWWTGG